MNMKPLHTVRAGQGPLLLLLHGIGSSATAWNRQIERLGKQFSCIAPDLPGYGDSPDASGGGLDGIVEDIAAVLDGQQAHVVGVSFGALAALALARRHPEQVKSLTLADATLGRALLPPDERERWLQHRASCNLHVNLRVARAAKRPRRCKDYRYRRIGLARWLRSKRASGHR